MKHAVLVTGANGQLGMELQRLAWPSGWEVFALDRTSLDLSNTSAIAETVASHPWAAVINGAAYTAVDKAESDAVMAWMVNAVAPAAFGAACAKASIPLIQLSTDYVFPGNKDGSWDVNDPVGPLNIYGASKLGGELAVRASGSRHAIVRTSWVVSSHGNNFVKTMLRLAEERDTLNVVGDQFGSPTSAADLALALSMVAINLASDQQMASGTFHFSNAGRTSWADFAREIFRQSAERGGSGAQINSIGAAEFPTSAKRPTNSTLNNKVIGDVYGIIPRPWQSALGGILDELIGTTK